MKGFLKVNIKVSQVKKMGRASQLEGVVHAGYRSTTQHTHSENCPQHGSSGAISIILYIPRACSHAWFMVDIRILVR